MQLKRRNLLADFSWPCDPVNINKISKTTRVALKPIKYRTYVLNAPHRNPFHSVTLVVRQLTSQYFFFFYLFYTHIGTCIIYTYFFFVIKTRNVRVTEYAYIIYVYMRLKCNLYETFCPNYVSGASTCGHPRAQIEFRHLHPSIIIVTTIENCFRFTTRLYIIYMYIFF